MKRTTRLAFTLAVPMMVGACGTNPAEKPAQTGDLQDAAPVAQESKPAAPQRVIVRIPLDEAGNPTGAPEMRLVQTADSEDSPEAISSQFARGSAPALLTTEIDELDRDSSTQSWHWNQWNWRGGWHNWGWNRFQPRMYWGGHHWNYGFVRNLNWNGYVYGCFDRGWW